MQPHQQNHPIDRIKSPNKNNYLIFILTFIFFLLILPESYPIAHLPTHQPINYFGTEYKKLIPITDIFNPVNFFYPNVTIYTNLMTLNQAFTNVSSIHIIFSSFRSSTTSNFGFTCSTVAPTEPISSITIQFKVQTSSLFSMLGFTVFIITRPFDKIFTHTYLQMAAVEVVSKTYFPLPSLYRLTVFIQSLSISVSIDYLDLSNIQTYYNSVTQQICAKIVCNLKCLQSIIYKVKIIILIYNRDNFDLSITSMFDMHSNIAMGLHYKSSRNGPLSPLLMNTFFDHIDKVTIYGIDHRYKCIIGFQKINGLVKNNPEFNYGLGATGVISLFDNSVTNLMGIQLLCFIRWACPVGYSFRHHQSDKCHDCLDGYIIPGNNTFHALCQTQKVIFRRYQYAINHQILNTCIYCEVCIATYVSVYGKCQQCSTYCNTCTSPTNCTQCIDNSVKILIGSQHVCKIIGCNQILPTTNNTFVCVYCNQFYKFDLVDGRCHCKLGYQLNWVNLRCEEKCGDGYTILAQCDDGNLINGDGCNDQCLIQQNFICNVTFNSTFCKYQAFLQLEIYKIIKNKGNSANIVIKAINNFFPFPFGSRDFSSQSSIKYVNIFLVDTSNSLNNKLLESEVIQSFSNEIQLLVNYDIQIQNLPAMIVINTTKTRYVCDQNKATLNFTLRGDNTRLKLTQNSQAYGGISLGILINIILTDLLFCVGLISNKYIGLQAIITLQLTYYSQLLINPVQKWPSGFQSLQYLKYANGYNQFVNFTDYLPKSVIQKKFNYMGIKKFPIQNYNLSSIILIMVYILFIIIIVYSNYNKVDEKKGQNKKNKKRQIQSNGQKMFRKCYQSISQLSKWSILQLLSSFTAFLSISFKDIVYFTQPSLNILSIQKLLFFISFIITLSIGLNNFFNLYLSNQMFGKIKRKSRQLLYKRLFFIYLLLIGFMIFFFNQEKIIIIPMSALVLIIHLIYTILVNFYIKPYKNSLMIHQIMLFLQHTQYTGFLVIINYINFCEQVSDSFLIFLGYLININCIITVIVTFFRLYFQYCYGQELEKQIIQERQKQEKLKFEQMLNIKKNIKKNNKENRQNKYRYENQIFQDKKQNFFDWIQKRNHLTFQEKQKIFFAKFEEKPLNWMKKKQPEKYQKIIKYKQKIKINQNQSIQQKQKKSKINLAKEQQRKFKNQMLKKIAQKKQNKKNSNKF